jgi:hypothetical protein
MTSTLTLLLVFLLILTGCALQSYNPVPGIEIGGTDRAKADADTLACWQHGIAEEKASGGELGISAAGAVGGALVGIGGLAGMTIGSLAYDAARPEEALARHRRFMDSVEGCMVSRGYARTAK